MKKSNATSAGHASRDAVARIADALRAKLDKLEPGARLPSVRALTERHTASPVTVQRALAQLAREGRLVTRPGDGTFAAESSERAKPVDVSFQALALGDSSMPIDLANSPFAAASPSLIPLGTGYMDLASQPLALLRQASLRASKREHVWSRLPSEGLEPLRSWFAREIGVSARQLLIVPGGQAALSVVIRALVAPGGPMLFESPTYFGALAIARAAGIRPIPVPSDAEGIVPAALEAAIARTGARVVYVQPTYANPTGSSMSGERRRALIELAQRASVFLIEDDYARDLTIDGQAPPPLVRSCPSHVVYVRSLTKTAAPGMRIAVVAALGPAFERLRTARAVDDWFVSGMLQETALELVGTPGWSRHIAQLRATLRIRRDAALEALRAELPALAPEHTPRGGFNLWLPLPSGLDDVAVAKRAELEGVHINAGRLFYPAEAVGPHLRLSYAAAEPRELREGVRRLARVLVKL
jgi:DNA-binding transcriptional MocR family regulator